MATRKNLVAKLGGRVQIYAPCSGGTYDVQQRLSIVIDHISVVQRLHETRLVNEAEAS